MYCSKEMERSSRMSSKSQIRAIESVFDIFYPVRKFHMKDI